MIDTDRRGSRIESYGVLERTPRFDKQSTGVGHFIISLYTRPY